MLSSIYAFQVGAVIVPSYRWAWETHMRCVTTQSPLTGKVRPWSLCPSLVFFWQRMLVAPNTKKQNGAAESKPPVSWMFLASECLLWFEQKWKWDLGRKVGVLLWQVGRPDLEGMKMVCLGSVLNIRKMEILRWKWRFSDGRILAFTPGKQVQSTPPTLDSPSCRHCPPWLRQLGTPRL